MELLKPLVFVTALVFFLFYETQSGEISKLESRPLRISFEVCPLEPGSCPQYIKGEEKFHPYPGDVARYCQCAHGTPVAMDCPLGLHWNRNANICDWPMAPAPPKEPEPVPETAPIPEPAPVNQ